MIIYAPSFPTIVFALQNFKLEEITILTSHPGIKDFCKTSGIALQYWEYNTDTSLKGMFNYKKRLNEIAFSFRDKEFLFCYTLCDLWGLFLIDRLKNHNKIYFYNKDPIHPRATIFSHLYIKGYRRVLFNKLVYFIVTGKWFDVFEITKTNFFLGQTEKRFRKKFLKYYTSNNENSVFLLNQQKIINAFDLPDYDILFIDDGALFYDYDLNLLNELKNLLIKTGLKVLIKHHPENPLSNTIFKEFEIFTKPLPAELFVNKGKLIMGVYSISLSYLSKYQTTISMYNLVNWRSEKYKKNVKLYLGQGEIIFPKDFDALAELVNSIV